MGGQYYNKRCYKLSLWNFAHMCSNRTNIKLLSRINHWWYRWWCARNKHPPAKHPLSLDKIPIFKT